LVFYAGLEKKEISSLRISDIRYENSDIAGIDPGSLARKDRFIHLPTTLQKPFNDYLDYFSSTQKYPKSPDGPLFPGYEGENGGKKFDRHLETLSGDKGLRFDKIHKLGMIYHSGLSSVNQTDRPTHEQFRRSVRSVKDLMAGRIQPAGKKKSIGDKLSALVDSDFRLKSRPVKPMSISNASEMIVPRDAMETFDMLIYLLDNICVLPLSDLREIERYRELFDKTLSALACCGIGGDGPIWKNIKHERVNEEKLKIGEPVTKKTREAFWKSFSDTFLDRNVVFTARSGSIYSTEEAPRVEAHKSIEEIVKEGIT